MADEYYAPPCDASISPYTDNLHGSGPEHIPSRPAPAERNQQRTEKRSRRRAPKACGECRRLKLKCDRVFPCQSCVKRGCEGICPDGSLVSGRGSRYILANTEQLHEKIVVMADRIRELEDALRVMSDEHALCPNTTFKPPAGASHTLLSEERLRVKSSLELYGLTHPPHSATDVRRSPSGSISDDSELDGSRFSNPQNLLTPPTQPELTDVRNQYFNQSQGNSNTFSSMNSQPMYNQGDVSVSAPRYAFHRRNPPTLSPQTYISTMSSTSTGMGTDMMSPLWAPDPSSPTARTDSQQFAGSYNASSSVVPAPQHMNTFSGDLYQAPQQYQTVAHASFPTSYPPMHVSGTHNVRPAMSDEELLRRYRT